MNAATPSVEGTSSLEQRVREIQAGMRGKRIRKDAKGIPLRHEFIMASSRDAGNMSMRKACRKAWNEEDRDAAQAVVDRLLPYYLADQREIARRAAVAS